MKQIFGILSSLFLVLALASPSWAFPDNGILATFTEADNTTPPTGFTNGVIGLAAGALWVQDNAVTGVTNSVHGDAYWNATTFPPECEAYALFDNTASTVSAGVFCRLANIGVSTTDGYAVFGLPATSVFSIYVLDNGTLTKLGADISQAMDPGDSFGIRTVGDQICAWFDNDGAGWTQLGCRTDTTYSAGGHIGIAANGSLNTTGRLGSFGGGAVRMGQSNTGFLGVILP